jgi:phosphopantothenoylcysteine decarboxylase/phosphopantothenate--cysteine ligase
MSEAATSFIHPNTFQALTGQAVLTETHAGATDNGMAHINLTRQADVFLIAPASANTIAKIANGIADNLITNLAIARDCPLILAPAMNVQMWQNPATQRNITQLKQDGIRILYPASGVQACGEIGMGRMLEAEQLADLLPDSWHRKGLQGKKILITTGANYEKIDPVRGITNISTGQMGMSLAKACRAAGAEVTLVHGLLQVPIVSGLKNVIAATSAQDMYQAVMDNIDAKDVFISVAAVSDYKVKNSSEQKIKKDKNTATPPVIELAENPDILASVAKLENAPFCVGFAAESQSLLPYARAKRLKKGVPLLVANLVSQAMGQVTNQVTLIDDKAEIALPQMSKDDTAYAIVERIVNLMP